MLVVTNRPLKTFENAGRYFCESGELYIPCHDESISGLAGAGATPEAAQIGFWQEFESYFEDFYGAKPELRINSAEVAM